MTTYKKKNLVNEEIDDIMEINDEIVETSNEISETNDNEGFEYPIIMQKIIESQIKLQEIDDYFNELPNLQSKVDEEIQDLLHYIENNELTPKQSVKMIKILHDKRQERRLLCNDFEIKKAYGENKNKMISSSQRPFLLNIMYQKEKSLRTQYKNRRYTEDEILQMLKGK